MSAPRAILRALAGLLIAVSLAGCGARRDPGFQGWVEADMIFVSPDEYGRVTTLNVREGDEVKVGDPLFSLDDDLQQAENERPQDHHHERGDNGGHPEAVGALHHIERNIGAQQIERPMRQVDNAHHAEREGEPTRQEEQQHAERQPVEDLRSPVAHARLMPPAAP